MEYVTIWVWFVIEVLVTWLVSLVFLWIALVAFCDVFHWMARPARRPPPPQPAPPEPESELATQIVAALRRGEVYVPPELRETAPESASGARGSA